MIKQIAYKILFLLLLSTITYSVLGQEICVRLTKDNKEVELDDNFQIIIYSFDSVATIVTKPIIKKNCFYMPTLVDTTEKVILFKKRRFIVGVKADISKIDQKMNWNFGVDNKPFNEDNSYLVKENLKDEVQMLVYLDFDPKEKGDGTRVTVIVNKKKEYKKSIKAIIKN